MNATTRKQLDRWVHVLAAKVELDHRPKAQALYDALRFCTAEEQAKVTLNPFRVAEKAAWSIVGGLSTGECVWLKLMAEAWDAGKLK